MGLERVVIEIPNGDKKKLKEILKTGDFATKTDFFRNAIREFDLNETEERIFPQNLSCLKCGERIPLTVIIKGKPNNLKSLLVKVERGLR